MLVALAAACDADSSCEVPTDRMAVVAVVSDLSSSVRARLELTRGPTEERRRSVRLCEDDILTIGGRDPVETEQGESFVYGVTFRDELPRIVTYVLERGSGEILDFEVALPEPFEVLEPTDGESVSRTEDLSVRWDFPRADAEIWVQLTEDIGGGVCFETPQNDYKRQGGIAIADSGAWTLSADEIQGDPTLRCDALLELRRIERGPYPAAFAPGGRVEAEAIRGVEFESVP